MYGVSGGGPHALACAALLGERVTRVAVSGSVGPADDPELDWFAGMHPRSVPELRAALQRRAALEPFVLPAIAAAREDPAAVIDPWLDDLPEWDRRILLAPGRRELEAELEAEAARQGGEGWIDDDLAFARAWGFELEAIAVPVRLWQADADVLVPPAHARRLADRIAGAQLELVPGAGHWLEPQEPSMLAWLAGR